MPNPVLRVLLAITALLAVLLLGGAGLPIAAAEPTDPGQPDSTSEPPTGEPEPTSAAPTPVPTSTPAPVAPQTLFGAIRDLLHRPFSIFGNGRVPGEPPTTVVTGPDGTVTPTRGRSRDKPTNKPDPEDLESAPDPVFSDPNTAVPQQKWSSSFDVVLPFHPPVSIPLPPVNVPGYENLRLTLDLTNPQAAFSSLQATTNTINSLLADAYAPYNPFKPPAPEPQPTFKILQEEPEPVVEAAGGNVTPVAQSSGDLPVLQAPAMAPPVRVALPRPVTGNAPADAGAQVPGSGTVGVRGPEPRGSVPQPAPTAQGANPAASAMGRPAPREGYQQYLQSARTGQVAAIAVPGFIGLLALTASGVVTGYRQANSQRYVRAEAARFL